MAGTPAQRQEKLLRLLADGEYSTASLAQRLRSSERTVRSDVASLRARFPGQVVAVPGGDGRSRRYRCQGLPPTVLPNPITYLGHDETLALIAARGLLRDPERRTPGWERPSSPYAGDLSSAIHGLLLRAGLVEQSRAVAPRALCASRFAVAADPPRAVAVLLHALSTNAAVTFHYRTRQGEERERHVLPMRLVYIRGEAHCFAWSPSPTGGGSVRQFRVSRITRADPPVRLSSRLPPGCPLRAPHDDIDAMLASGFNATGSADRQAQRRVVVGIHPDSWPDVIDRCWGETQRDEPAPDLGPGWRRLSFLTTGLPECRGWVLSMGANARPEAPAELVTWCWEQASRLACALAPIAAENAAANAATMKLETGAVPSRTISSTPGRSP